MKKNTSGLAPLGKAVLVEHYEPERKGSLIVMPESVEVRGQMVEQRVIIIEVGPNCWKDEPARAVPGDRVFVSAMSGYMCRGPADGKMYRVVNERDIFMKITSEESCDE
jgi:co-chaperonin GroES (HSP10)